MKKESIFSFFKRKKVKEEDNEEEKNTTLDEWKKIVEIGLGVLGGAYLLDKLEKQ